MFDPFYLAVESIFLLCLLVFLTLFFIPSKKKVYAGEVGRLESPAIPIILGLSSLLLVIFIVFVFLVDFTESIMQVIFILFWVLFLLPATLFTLMSYLRAKRWVKDFNENAPHYPPHQPQPGEAPPPPHPGVQSQSHQQPAGHQPQDTMTVECPGCGSHIRIPAGSHHITCPHCGLSGTL